MCTFHLRYRRAEFDKKMEHAKKLMHMGFTISLMLIHLIAVGKGCGIEGMDTAGGKN